MANSRGGNANEKRQTRAACGEKCTRVVLRYARLKPNIGFWKRHAHTFDRTSRIKDNSSVAGDWLIDWLTDWVPGECQRPESFRCPLTCEGRRPQRSWKLDVSRIRSFLKRSSHDSEKMTECTKAGDSKPEKNVQENTSGFSLSPFFF